MVSTDRAGGHRPIAGCLHKGGYRRCCCACLCPCCAHGRVAAAIGRRGARHTGLEEERISR